MHAVIQQLSQTLVDYLQPDQTLEIPEAGITLYRCDSPIERISYVQQPSICMILFGEKDVYWGERHFRYGSGEFCCYSIDLPVIGEVKHASPAAPYTGIQVALNASILSRLMLELGTPPVGEPGAGVEIGQLTPALLGALQRLLDALCDREESTILVPLILHEIHYRLLKSPQGATLCQMITLGSHRQRVAAAIEHLKKHYAESQSMDALARRVNMSAPSFYKHFRKITGLSPLQYQKSLRLIEARRLILQGQSTLTTIANDIGYESASQFSREYSRFFGVSPRADGSTAGSGKPVSRSR